MTSALYILAGVLILAIICLLLLMIYRNGYQQGREDQILDDSKSFLRSVQRHEQNKTHDQ
jgi:uncharacterized membrane protein YqiK